MNKIIQAGDGKQYKLLSVLGEGQFGKVFKAIDQNNQEFALKFIQKNKLNNPKIIQLFKNELYIMMKVNHPRILKLYNKIENQEYIILVTQLCDGGNLEEFLFRFQKSKNQKGIGADLATHYLIQILEGFEAMHQTNYKIMHRDLKLANLMMNKGDVVIGDFGFAKLGESMAGTGLGTPFYMAPEVFETSKQKKKYSNKCDVWSLGVCYYHLLFGKLPFIAESEEDLLNQICNFSGKRLKIPRDFNINYNIENLLKLMLEPDTSERIGFKELFNHPFLSANKQSYQSTADTLDQRSFQYSNNQNINMQSQFTKNSQKRSKVTNYTNPQQQSQQNSQQTLFSNQKSQQKMQISMNQFAFSHQLGQESQMSQLSQESLTEMKQILAPYFYHKNLLIFLVDCCKRLKKISQNKNYSEILVISEILFLVILKKAITIGNQLSNVLKQKQNAFNINNFDQLVQTRPYQNLITFFVYFENWVGNLFSVNKKEFYQNINQKVFDLHQIEGYSKQRIDEHIIDSTFQILKFYKYKNQQFSQSEQNEIIKLNIYLFFCHKVYEKFPLPKYSRGRDWKVYCNVIDNKTPKECENILSNYFNQDKIQINY